MTDPDDAHWEDYYKAIAGRAPRPLFLEVLRLFEPIIIKNQALNAIDLGCGDGTETFALLKKGWRVLALDQQREAIDRVLEIIPADLRAFLSTQVTSFEDSVLPPADLIYAGLSLPFCSREHFRSVWDKVVRAVRPQGRFAGHFFGDRDGWATEPEMVFLSNSEVLSMFSGFELEYFKEIDEDGQTATQGPKHWHLFEVIARK